MSTKFDLAVAFAAEAHSGAVRKITGIPFLLHPMEVASTAAALTTDEDIIIAALLHDTVEDAKADPARIEELFGPRVRALVSAETENRRSGPSSEKNWKERKTESLRELQSAADPAVKILWLADKLSNMRSVYSDWLREGDAVFLHFHMKDKAEHAWYYRSVLEAVGSLAGTGAYNEFRHLIRTVFADIPACDTQKGEQPC